MLLNCHVGEDSWESLGLQRDQTSQSQRKSILNIHWKDWCWRRLMGRLNSLEKTLMQGKIEGRKRGDNRKWEGWTASPTQWTRVWARSGRWWKTGKPVVLQSMGSQRVKHDWATELIVRLQSKEQMIRCFLYSHFVWEDLENFSFKGDFWNWVFADFGNKMDMSRNGNL